MSELTSAEIIKNRHDIALITIGAGMTFAIGLWFWLIWVGGF